MNRKSKNQMIPARWRYKMDNPIALINPGEM